MEKEKITILGATGSIGKNALDVIAMHPERFEVEAITGGNNIELLISLAQQYRPKYVAIANEDYYNQLKEACNHSDIQVFAGQKGLKEVAHIPVDRTVAAISGISGLGVLMEAIPFCNYLLLASKEALITAWPIIKQEANKYQTQILPIDSEHNSLFQLMQTDMLPDNWIEKIILTASGGPFYGHNYEDLSNVTPAQACRHPNWSMGAKISLDSATLMNKGLEIVEAAYFFNVSPKKLDILVHKQSVVHAMLYYCNGNIKAGLNYPDMRIPIAYCLHYPQCVEEHQLPRLDLAEIGELHFEQVDYTCFPSPKLMFNAIEQGRHAVIVANAANEITTHAFLDLKIGFHDIYKINEKITDIIAAQFTVNDCQSIESVLDIDTYSKMRTNKLLQQY